LDLHLIPGAVATPAERAAIDAVILSSHPAPGTEHAAGTDARSTQHLAPSTRHLLLPALHAAQTRAGWISEGALNYICERLSVPPADAYGVASFYSLYSLKPRPPLVAHVCDDIACRANGAEAICQDLERRAGPAGESPVNERATWMRSPCLGQCDRAPAALIQRAGSDPSDWTLTSITVDAIVATLRDERSDVVSGFLVPPKPQSGEGGSRTRDNVYADPPRLLRRVGVADPTRLDAYRANGGYEALARALEMGASAVIREVTDARLVGRGGALFPTGRKWDAVARATVRPHYLVCNADESEPGTFKDRVLMEEDPFAVIEAMTIAAYATGCEQGYIYIRGEYPLATERLLGAVAQARTAGLLGERMIDTPVRFDIELRRGAGAYICGEETALFNSIEGFRGEPRNKPPFPVQSGLFGKPTVVNNVETLVNVLDIVRDGGAEFTAVGTGQSTGTKLFCVSGCAARPGLYEVPFGITLRQLIDRAGGVRDARPLRAVLLGGAAGVFIGPDEIDLTLSIEGASAAAATIGSGVVMLFDDRVDLRDITMRIARFFRHESCGQCVPCRIGTVRQEEALHRLAGSPASRDQDFALIDDLAQAMRDASICGLGQTASSAVQSAITKLRVFG
jgi:NADH-quinone oxidoreductase subunit F